MINIKVNQIKIRIEHTQDDVIKKALSILHTDAGNLDSYEILKKSIDSRKEPVYIYSIKLSLKKYNTKRLPKEASLITKEIKYAYSIKGEQWLKYQPVIIGFGPAGMFCGYMLAKAGYKPIILERGKNVESRQKDVEHFFETGELNTESNIQFGEGGAGTFSDGKLNTGIKDKLGRQKLVLDILIECGAPKEIAYDSKPHIGTDILCTVVKNIRLFIEENGGEVRFNSKLTDIKKNKDEYILKINNDYNLLTNICVLALGHSARDTFEMLYDNNFEMCQKPFAIGVRAEHKQIDISRSQYGVDNIENLPPAPYKITYNTQKGRGVYSFCMCPGGFVVNASSEKGQCVVNGMSYSKRDSENANSAIVTTITPSDFEGDHPLAGMYLQRELEKKAFDEGKGYIPVQRYQDFVNNKISESTGYITPNIKGKYSFGNIKNILPPYISEAIEEAMPMFGKKINKFDDDDVIFSAIESRTSSPVRIIRNDLFESNYEGVYPCGEGAGYAGGITSAAIDGVKVFEAIIARYNCF